MPGISAFLITLAVFIVSLPAGKAYCGGAYVYGPDKTIIGQISYYHIRGDETLHEVAVASDTGYNSIMAANPGIDPWLPGNATRITIPSSWILPAGKQKGIIINLAEMRLYRFLDIRGERLVTTYPIGIGTEGFDTPLGRFRIAGKEKDPAWHVPPSIRRENPDLPAVVPPGRDNPLGPYALRLSIPTYLLHGTSRPFGIGHRASHGCIRLYNQDVKSLFYTVRTGTPVRIVYQPIKAGILGGRIYIEVNKDYLKRLADPYQEALKILAGLGNNAGFNKSILKKALREGKGIPVDITARKASPKS